MPTYLKYAVRVPILSANNDHRLIKICHDVVIKFVSSLEILKHFAVIEIFLISK